METFPWHILRAQLPRERQPLSGAQGQQGPGPVVMSWFRLIEGKWRASGEGTAYRGSAPPVGQGPSSSANPCTLQLDPPSGTAMTEKATLEAPACGLEETASESARVPPTEPSGDTAALQAPGGEQAPGGQQASEPQESAHQPPDPTASAAPAAPTATDPALPREGDESWGGRRGEAVMAGSGGG